MEAKIMFNATDSAVVKAEEFKTGDGFLKFKNVQMDDSKVEEEVWIPIGMARCIIWKDKPADPEPEKEKE